MLERAIELVQKADILIIIGTSMQVYPAASLINYIKTGTPIYFIDPQPNISKNYDASLTIIPKIASDGMEELIDKLKM